MKCCHAIELGVKEEKQLGTVRWGRREEMPGVTKFG